MRVEFAGPRILHTNVGLSVNEVLNVLDLRPIDFGGGLVVRQLQLHKFGHAMLLRVRREWLDQSTVAHGTGSWFPALRPNLLQLICRRIVVHHSAVSSRFNNCSLIDLLEVAHYCEVVSSPVSSPLQLRGRDVLTRWLGNFVHWNWQWANVLLGDTPVLALYLLVALLRAAITWVELGLALFGRVHSVGSFVVLRDRWGLPFLFLGFLLRRGRGVVRAAIALLLTLHVDVLRLCLRSDRADCLLAALGLLQLVSPARLEHRLADVHKVTQTEVLVFKGADARAAETGLQRKNKGNPQLVEERDPGCVLFREGHGKGTALVREVV